jgi:PAS domain S-box-containing protein
MILRKLFLRIKTPLGITSISYLMVFLVGVLDHITNPEFAFSLFYLIPISFNTWYLNRKNGILISLMSALVWLYVDSSSASSYESFIAPYWNSAIRLGFFLIIVFLLTEIKYLYLNLEKMVKERTIELTGEIIKKNEVETELIMSRNLYQDLVENISEVYYTTDENGYFRYVSPNFYKSTGLNEADLSGKSFYDIMHPEDRNRIRYYYSSVTGDNRTDAACEFRIVRRGKTSIWFEQNSKILLRDGNPVEIRNLLRNINDRKAAEISLIKSEIRFKRIFSNEEDTLSENDYMQNMLHSDPAYIISSLADRIDDITEKISGRIKQALGFSSLASHELRTPLAIIRNQLEENLRADTPLQDLRATSASIYDEVLRLQRIIGDLLELSKMESGKLRLHKDNIRLDEFIRLFYEDARLLAQDKRVTVNLCSLIPVEAKIDKAYFLQMLFNIFDNALKYTEENGSITIGYNLVDNVAEIFLKDTGRGIPAALIGKLFTPFYQNESDNLSSGTGLGLILSRWIAELHDGGIQIESTVKEGTEVIISVPVTLI